VARGGGRAWQTLEVAPWKLPLVVAAIAVPIVAAFYVSPGLGLAVGALAAVSIVVMAARQRPRGALGQAVADPERQRLLVVITRPVDDPAAIEEIAAMTRDGEGSATAEVLVVSPARIGFLDRWASNVEGARREAQRRLVVTVAALAGADVAAEARVGDEDLVQAVEDQLESFPATAVVLVTGRPGEDEAGEEAAAELERRLRVGFERLVLGGPSGPAAR
jgi:hypothetical protein